MKNTLMLDNEKPGVLGRKWNSQGRHEHFTKVSKISNIIKCNYSQAVIHPISQWLLSPVKEICQGVVL